MGYLGLILGALGVVLISSLWSKLLTLVWRPYALTKRLKKQGVMGPEYRLGSGCLDEIRRLESAARETVLDTNSHEIIPRVLPHYFKWMKQYGGTFLYWMGLEPRLCITDPESAKQVLSNKFGYYPKTQPPPGILAIMGRGLIFAEGAAWARHRRVVSPAFAMDKLKLMIKQMAKCTVPMLDSWHEEVVQAHNPIEVQRPFQKLTADVISHSAFGSSYAEGKEVFVAQQELFVLTFTNPLTRFNFLPTELNRRKWKLDKKIKNKLVSIIQSRLNSKGSGSGYGNDLLGLMLESTEKEEGMGLTMNEIVDECKTFFFAGHETTSQLLSWTMFLLSTNPDWQEKLRDEVMRECGKEIPNASNLSKLKLVTMVLFESLRLYCPVVMTLRVAAKDMDLGNLTIPKGTTVSIPFAVIHREKECWGEDVNEFNPLRFENGITKAAKHPNALLAFSVGPRACTGQDFAMLEAKTVIAMVLQRFSFSLSPEYKHMPTNRLTLQPQEGLPLVLKPLVS